MTDLALPTTTRVAVAWLALALPDVPAGTDLPTATATTRAKGYLQVQPIGGSRATDNLMRSPIVAASAWFPPPADGSVIVQWNAAEQLAARVMNGSDRPDLTGRLVHLTPAGSYRDAFVHAVNVLGEVRQVEGDPNHYARFDMDLEINWNGV